MAASPDLGLTVIRPVLYHQIQPGQRECRDRGRIADRLLTSVVGEDLAVLGATIVGLGTSFVGQPTGVRGSGVFVSRETGD